MAATKRLIINADDLGLSPGINRGIIRAFKDGIVTSASLLPNANGIKDAETLLKENPDIGVGIHLTLVTGYPVSEPDRVPTLLDENGAFFPSYHQFLKKLLSIELREVKIEFEAQIGRALDMGIKPTHIDTHQHLHLLPQVADIVLELASKNKIDQVRCPGGKGGWGFYSIGVALLSSYLLKKIKGRGLSTTDHFAGFSFSGQMTKTDLIETLLGLKPGATELMVHPGIFVEEEIGHLGWEMNWEEELSALTSSEVKVVIDEQSIELVSYKDACPEACPEANEGTC